MANQNTVERVLELARGELGATSGDKYIKYYNELTGIGLPYGVAWCAAWVTWVMRHAGVPTDSVLNYKGCTTGSAWFAARGRFKSRQSGYIPKPGDIIMYEWNPEDEGTPGDDGDDHTGIVEYVENGKVHTIEGNNDGRCRRDWWGLSNDFISGYCVPLYNTETKTETKEEEEMTQDKFNQMMDVYLAERNKKPADKWAEPAIAMCKEWSIMEGDDTRAMRPQSFIKREEAAQMFYSLLGRGQDSDPWAKEVWDKAVAAKVFDGNNPRAPFTREQAAMVLYRLGLLPDAPIAE